MRKKTGKKSKNCEHTEKSENGQKNIEVMQPGACQIC